MAQIFRLLLILCLAAMICPAVLALLLLAWGRLIGCGADAAACLPADLGEALRFTLEWAWQRVLDVRILALFTIGAAIGAAYGFATRSQALLWGLGGACWGPVAALILPYAATFWSLPDGCSIRPGGFTPCVFWGADMTNPYRGAAAALWLSVYVMPLSLAGILLTFILVSLRRRPPTDIGASGR